MDLKKHIEKEHTAYVQTPSKSNYDRCEHRTVHDTVVKTPLRNIHTQNNAQDSSSYNNKFTDITGSVSFPETHVEPQSQTPKEPCHNKK